MKVRKRFPELHAVHARSRDELVPGIEVVPTYGNTLMGLASPKPFDPADGYSITLGTWKWPL